MRRAGIRASSRRRDVVVLTEEIGVGMYLVDWSVVTERDIWTQVSLFNNNSTPDKEDLAARTGIPLRGLYKDSVASRTDSATGPSQAQVNAWEAANGGTGGYLRTSGGTILTYDGNRLTDPANDAVTDICKDNWTDDATYGIDLIPGLTCVMCDNGFLDYSIAAGTPGTFSAVGYTGSYPTLTPETTDNAWARFHSQRLARLAAHVQQNGYAMTANCWGIRAGSGLTNGDNSFYSDTFLWWDTCLRFAEDNTLGPGGTAWRPGEPILDGYFVEYFVMTPTFDPRYRSDQASPSFRDHWGEMVDLMLIVRDFTTDGAPTPRAFVGNFWGNSGTPSTDERNARYTRGSFLLRWTKTDNSCYSSTGIGDASGYANVSDGDIGSPQGDPYEIDSSGAVLKTHTGRFTGPSISGGQPVSNFASTASLIARDYSNGWVLVNATKSSITVTGGTFSGETVPAADAIIHVGA